MLGQLKKKLMKFKKYFKGLQFPPHRPWRSDQASTFPPQTTTLLEAELSYLGLNGIPQWKEPNTLDTHQDQRKKKSEIVAESTYFGSLPIPNSN